MYQVLYSSCPRCLQQLELSRLNLISVHELKHSTSTIWLLVLQELPSCYVSSSLWLVSIYWCERCRPRLMSFCTGLLFGWENSSTSGLYINRYYQQRFGQCDNAACTSSSLPTLRQSTIAGCFSIGAFVGALSAGYVASHVSTLF